MPVITIARQTGSLGDEIGTDVAERLHLRVVDQDLVDEVALRLGVPPAQLTERDERETTLVSELVRTMRRLYPATISPLSADTVDVDAAAFAQVIRQVIWEVARADDAVILGRGASFILGEHPETVHVLIVAPFDIRLERVMATESLDRGAANKRLRESDANRARYIRHLYRANWLDAANYDLVINTGHFSELRAASLICAAAARQDSSG